MAAATAAREAVPGGRRRQRLMVLAVLSVVIAVDQAAKWWAWRHVAGADINPGGDFVTGPAIGRWYANPVTGALLDLAGCGFVSIAAAVLARRRRRPAVTVCGALMVGGWASNLADRLGMHYWTAPGSIRGAVDFISMGGVCWNLADFAIIGATPLFLLAATCMTARAASRPASPATAAARRSPRARVPILALFGAGVVMTVALGAAHDGGLTRPSPAGPSTRQYQRPAHLLGGAHGLSPWTGAGPGTGAVPARSSGQEPGLPSR